MNGSCGALDILLSRRLVLLYSVFYADPRTNGDGDGDGMWKMGGGRWETIPGSLTTS